MSWSEVSFETFYPTNRFWNDCNPGFGITRLFFSGCNFRNRNPNSQRNAYHHPFGYPDGNSHCHADAYRYPYPHSNRDSSSAG